MGHVIDNLVQSKNKITNPIYINDEIKTSAYHGVLARTNAIYDTEFEAFQSDINKLILGFVDDVYSVLGSQKYNSIGESLDDIHNKYNGNIPEGEYVLIDDEESGSILYQFIKEYSGQNVPDAQQLIDNNYIQPVKIGDILYQLKQDIVGLDNRLRTVETNYVSVENNANELYKIIENLNQK